MAALCNDEHLSDDSRLLLSTICPIEHQLASVGPESSPPVVDSALLAACHVGTKNEFHHHLIIALEDDRGPA